MSQQDAHEHMPSPTPESDVRKYAAALLDLLREKNARLSFAVQRRYMIGPWDADSPTIFLTTGDDGSPLPQGAIIVLGDDEFELTPRAIHDLGDAIANFHAAE